MLNLLAVGAGDTGVNPWVALAYLVAGVCFILALRGLSSPATSRAGNRYGMIGMTIAVVTTLITHDIASLPEEVFEVLRQPERRVKKSCRCSMELSWSTRSSIAI